MRKPQKASAEDERGAHRHGDPGRAGEEQHARRRATPGRPASTLECELVAVEVLAHRGVEPAERREQHAAHERELAAVGVEADDQPEHDQHDPDEHAQLDERERVPRRLRPLVAQGRGPRRERPARRRCR